MSGWAERVALWPVRLDAIVGQVWDPVHYEFTIF
jgi:hypothetical protein